MIAFLIIFILLLLVAFLHEKQRLFIWMMIAYFVGELLYLYGNRFISDLPYHPNILLIIDKVLLLIPIMMILYVCYKFKHNILFFFKRVQWKKTVTFVFLGKERIKLTVLQLLLLAVFMTVLCYLPFMTTMSYQIERRWLLLLLAYAIVSSLMEEVLWRGLIMAMMKKLTNEQMAIFFSSAAYGLSYLMFGFSIAVCLFIALFGCLWAYMTIRAESLVPAMIWHSIFHIFTIFSGVFPFSPI